MDINKKLGKPFLKWVGGKTQLIEEIDSRIKECDNFLQFDTYVEPFVGGGAILFYVLKTHPNIKKVVINDINSSLIGAYLAVRDTPKELIAILKKMESIYLGLECESLRKEYFLDTRANYNRGGLSSLEKSAHLIFLNKTCFNGLYRENSKGGFNVPIGKYKNPKICDAETILSDSELLQGVEILNEDFSKTLNYASISSFYYIDPPYKPISSTSSFNSYTKESFNDDEQVRLKNFCDAVLAKGGKVILSNSDVSNNLSGDMFFDNLYDNYSIKRVNAKRSINSNSAKRGAISELLITNF